LVVCLGRTFTAGGYQLVPSTHHGRSRREAIRFTRGARCWYCALPPCAACVLCARVRPARSTRFALRQRLLPAIAECYGEGAHRNLASLAKASDALHDALQAEMVRPFLAATVEHGPLGVSLGRWRTVSSCALGLTQCIR